MKQNRHSSKKSQTKFKYTFNPKNKVIFEDATSKNVKSQIIFDKNEPTYKHTVGEKSGNNGN